MAALTTVLHFAWVTATDTTFDPTYARSDENIFSLEIEHLEGQIPTANVEIINPRKGLLNPTRPLWTWISFTIEGHGPTPLFFGRLVGIPESILANTITLQLTARRDDFNLQKQQAAEALKTLPNYDPIFFPVGKRDDPDAILEGWSRLYHVDRVAGLVSSSDILIGEDGTVTFDPSDVFYDSVQMRLLQAPLIAVNLKAEVSWEQQYQDHLYVGSWAWPTLGADAFVGEWPKSGGGLGGGWSAGVAWAGERDPAIVDGFLQTAQPGSYSYSYSWQNGELHHNDGDTMSVSISASYSGLPLGPKIMDTSQSGFIDPFATNSDGLPAPINIPGRIAWSTFDYRTFALNFQGKQSLATLGLVYTADRKRSERLELTLRADSQPTLYDPQEIQQYTETVEIKSGNLSLPQTDLLNWTTVADTVVTLGTTIFPDVPNLPGENTAQICTTAGRTGTTTPEFSNIAGTTTTDNAATWTSLGQAQPTENSQDWNRLALVPLGTLIIPKPVSGVPDINSIQVAGQLNYPPRGVPRSTYSVMTTGYGGPGATMYETTSPGMLGGPGPQCTLQSFTNPSGQHLFIAVQAGQTGEFHTTFNQTTGATTTDGTVVWQCLGTASLPIGGWWGATPARSYFPSDRGQLSVQHGLARARAKLRKRARAVQIDLETRFEVAAMLSCRMNGRITDTRLPGGTALGKVTAYHLSANGDTGQLKGKVTLGCSVGRTIPATSEDSPALSTTYTDPGLSYYVNGGYVNGGYAQLFATFIPPTVPPIHWTPPGPGDPGYIPVPADPAVGTPPPPPLFNVEFAPPSTPPGWPAIPPTLPTAGSPTGASSWAAGPREPSGEELGYAPPAEFTVDDGLRFPAAASDLILKSQWHGLASTLNPVNVALYNLQLQTIVAEAIASTARSSESGFQVAGASSTNLSVTVPVDNTIAIESAVQTAVLQNLLQGTGLWYELVLRPVTNGPFAAAYVVNTTAMSLPQTIDLEAPSSS